MIVFNRKQFIEYWENIEPGLGKEDSPLWLPESFDKTSRKSRWFISVNPLKIVGEEFQLWCHKHCKGQILCYSSGDVEEWWGFTHKADILWWTLKWS